MNRGIRGIPNLAAFLSAYSAYSAVITSAAASPLCVLRVSAFSLLARHLNRPGFGTALQWPVPVAGCRVNRRDLTMAVPLAEGVFKRRDAKNAEKRAFDADVISAPTR